MTSFYPDDGEHSYWQAVCDLRRWALSANPVRPRTPRTRPADADGSGAGEAVTKRTSSTPIQSASLLVLLPTCLFVRLFLLLPCLFVRLFLLLTCLFVRLFLLLLTCLFVRLFLLLTCLFVRLFLLRLLI